jgi:hypothetical protein
MREVYVFTIRVNGAVQYITDKRGVVYHVDTFAAAKIARGILRKARREDIGITTLAHDETKCPGARVELINVLLEKWGEHHGTALKAPAACWN